ncbi:heterokaryon incompatibility protein-domain-containing protein [Hypoxylon fuscum]|nr:heterokaryon incompatibility protein-domain-containing protein [Hypoxylon fuscum]
MMLEGELPKTYEQFCDRCPGLSDSKRSTSNGGARSSEGSTQASGKRPSTNAYVVMYLWNFKPNISIDALVDGQVMSFQVTKVASELGFSRETQLKFESDSTAGSKNLWNFWLRSCSESHDRCRVSKREAFIPDRLIQIRTNNNESGFKWRLVCHPDKCIEYLTLSHCWGSLPHHKLTKDNILESRELLTDSHLPKTYRDAFQIAVSLGFQFIWIDSLCIIQDDPGDWKTQSSKMGSIYSNAYCNIAATWAMDGSDGCFSKRDPFLVDPTILPLDLNHGQTVNHQIHQDAHHRKREVGYLRDVTDAPLNKRAWVVQERYLAKRQLSFAKPQVYWECLELSASEQYPAGIPTQLLYTRYDEVLPTPKPSIEFRGEFEFRRIWVLLVKLYSDCSVTHQSDKMIALSGLVQELQEITKDEYLAGLWKKDLSKQLCWEAKELEQSASRVRTSVYTSPTWSWASMDGPVSIDAEYIEEYMPGSKSTNVIEVIEASICSEDPNKSHSFTSSKLVLKGVAVWGRVELRSEMDYELQPGKSIQNLSLG